MTDKLHFIRNQLDPTTAYEEFTDIQLMMDDDVDLAMELAGITNKLTDLDIAEEGCCSRKKKKPAAEGCDEDDCDDEDDFDDGDDDDIEEDEELLAEDEESCCEESFQNLLYDLEDALESFDLNDIADESADEDYLEDEADYYDDDNDIFDDFIDYELARESLTIDAVDGAISDYHDAQEKRRQRMTPPEELASEAVEDLLSDTTSALESLMDSLF